MSQTESVEAQLYDYTHRLLQAHETLLGDAVRNRAFYKALEKCVTRDSCVLDIGAGTGVWAIAAAKLGAKKVFAVEKDEILIGLIKLLAREQGVAEKIETVCGSSFDVHLQKQFDLIVTETIGFLGFDENIVEIILDARKRFLVENGRLIPETVSLFAAAAHLNDANETIPNDLPFKFDQLARLNLNSPCVLNNKRGLKFVTESQSLIQVDLRDANEPPDLENLQAEWSVPAKGAKINCFIVWVESRLTEGVNLSTRQTSSWLPYIYRINPIEDDFKQIKLKLSLTKESNYWTVILSNGQLEQARSYSPEFAATELTLLSRTSDPTLIELYLSHLRKT